MSEKKQYVSLKIQEKKEIADFMKRTPEETRHKIALTFSGRYGPYHMAEQNNASTVLAPLPPRFVFQKIVAIRDFVAIRAHLLF